MSDRAARRQRPDLPYRKVPVRRLLLECNRRLHASRGPRAFEMMAALVYRWPQVQSGVVYIGDEGMAELMKRCGKTAHRAKYDLARAGLVKLHCAGPGLRAGGKILNGRGQVVAQATGYEIDPSILKAAPESRAASRAQARPAGSGYESPAQARLRREGQAKIRQALENMKARAPG